MTRAFIFGCTCDGDEKLAGENATWAWRRAGFYKTHRERQTDETQNEMISLNRLMLTCISHHALGTHIILMTNLIWL
jgi:hypothetical protein